MLFKNIFKSINKSYFINLLSLKTKFKYLNAIMDSLVKTDDNTEQFKRLNEESSDETNKKLKTDNISSETVYKKRIKKLKWVLLMSYCGRGYYGMQRQREGTNPSIKALPTIEEELMKSMLNSGLITEEQYKDMHVMHFQRAARTDKGVSAMKQIVSLVLPENFLEYIPKINEHLPQQIRLISGKRVTKYFDAKNFCDARTYSYLLPTYALCPIDQITDHSFRVTTKIIEDFNELLRAYIGTHNYFNFTAGIASTDTSAKRHIIEIQCSEQFIKEDMEFVVIRIKGQSFMLHQIRKMVGLAIAIMRGLTVSETITKAYNSERMDLPIAPGLGLLLEDIHYNRYNQKFGGDGIHEPINWDEYSDSINEFKHQYIYSAMVETEKNEMSMFQWLQTLPYHTFDIVDPSAPVRTQRLRGALCRAEENANNGEYGENDESQRIKVDNIS